MLVQQSENINDNLTKELETLITTHRKLNGLDHLRAFAIFFVFLFHYQILSSGQPEWLPDVATFGWTGVDLFFVLSGFLISSQLFDSIKNGQKISFKVFFLKRFFRIIPASGLLLASIFWCLFFVKKKPCLKFGNS